MNKKVTISDVAKAAEVNVSTVSRVINHDTRISENTRQHVYKIINELEYVPIRNRKKKNKEIIIALPHLKMTIIGDLVSQIDERLEGTNLDIRLVNLKGERMITEQIARDLTRENPAGVILISCYIDEEGASVFQTLDIPVVLGFGRSKQVVSVNVNDYDGIYEATTHVIENGYKKIGLINFSPSYYHSQARTDGFTNAMNKAGLDASKITFDALNMEGGYTATKQLLSQFDVKAIVYATDTMAFGGIEYLREIGKKYPDDIGIVSFDNTAFSRVIGLTSVDLLVKDISNMLMDYLLDMINNGLSEPKEALLTPHIVVRDSLKYDKNN